MIHNLFSTPIFKTKVDPRSYDKESIIKTCKENYEKNPYHNYWDSVSDLHHYHRDLSNGPDLKSLGVVYGKIVNEYMASISGDFRYRWHIINLAVNSKYMKAHDHFYRQDGWQGMFGGIHHISYDKEFHSPTKFLNPLIFAQYSHNTHDMSVKLDRSDINNSAYYPDTTMDVEEDDIIIFPSYLKHIVENGVKKESDKPRIVCVIDIKWKIL